MKTRLLFLIPLGLSVVLASGAAEMRETFTVVPSAKRLDTVEQAKQLLAPAPAAALPSGEALKNPFLPGRTGGDLRDPKAPPPMNDRDRLVLLAARVQPTGAVRLGETFFLLFRERKARAGETLSVELDGAKYAVEIVGIEANSYRLRYKREELTRPIK